MQNENDNSVIVDDSIDIFEKSPSIRKNGNIDKVSVPWVEKYRPKTIDDMILLAPTKKMLKEMLEKNELDSMTLFGEPGKGKTSLAKLLANSVNAEVLFIACGTDGTVDVVRNRIQPFCESASSGRIKCIILDEFDAASGGNAATNGMQKALRSLMEAYTDTRFIITCNYPQKIITPIFSRCPKVEIGFTLKDVAIRLKEIWDSEGIEYDKDTANEFCKRYVYPKMPDIRSILNVSQMFCHSGKLIITDDSQINVGNDAISEFADKVIESIVNGRNYKDVRHMVIVNSHIFNGDYEIMASALADSSMRKDLNPDIVTMLAESSYRMSQVTDPSLQMVGAIINLYKMLKD